MTITSQYQMFKEGVTPGLVRRPVLLNLGAVDFPTRSSQLPYEVD